jgi:hypothetical protein
MPEICVDSETENLLRRAPRIVVLADPDLQMAGIVEKSSPPAAHDCGRPENHGAPLHASSQTAMSWALQRFGNANVTVLRRNRSGFVRMRTVHVDG